MESTANNYREDIKRVSESRHHDPGIVLGRHSFGESVIIRSLLPHATTAVIADTEACMDRVMDTNVFEWIGPAGKAPHRIRIKWTDHEGIEHEAYDPYSFPLQISDFDIHLFAEGRHQQAYQFLGAQHRAIDGIEGILFATWAPNAERVSVIGEFNQWDGRCHPMRNRGNSGLWEIFIPRLAPGQLYKYELRTHHNGEILSKTDPYGRQFELRPETATKIPEQSGFNWSDSSWIAARHSNAWQHTPMSIYEVHPGSWRRSGNNQFLNYRELAVQLVPYVKELGFTHIELLPITEHPLDASWGYQTTGYYAPSSRYGTPEDFRWFVDFCHQHDIGVILDWVAGHFPKDAHGLARFDGTPLYEHEDPRRGEHREWGTLVFNYDRNEVRSFLVSNAHYWISEFHLDGLRVDAVASMIYLDYSRNHDEWLPNKYGGNENLEAIDFLRNLNNDLQGQYPGVVMIAEESTAWPMVTRPSWTGGLGFSMKWNMGWMHDTLVYMNKDPIHRHYHHDNLTFGLLYAFTENFILPLSHDEVVHGKGSMLTKMPGDEWQRFANLRLLYTCMFTYPGKKLLFMGNELAVWQEWDHDRSLAWEALDYPPHAGMQTLIRDLNRLYSSRAELHQHDFEDCGFEWLDCHDSSQSVLSYLRKSDNGHFVIALNFTPIPRQGYRLGVPQPGRYREILNSDSRYYQGSNMGNSGIMESVAIPWMGRPYSIELTLPPLAGVILEYNGAD
ncbi:MAG: 1,4-alpha-glucan branching protein GlgB [Gammaproteobacteria bacterium]